MKHLVLIALACALLSFGCSSETSTSVATVTATESTFETDPSIRRAESVIEQMPDSPVGHTQLAAAYIRKARQTSDFDLNEKAEAAVNRALEIAPADLTARKLQASLHLTFHRFAEGLEAGRRLQAEHPNDPFVYGVLSDAYTELGNYPLAVESAQKMVDLRPNTASYARAGNLRLLHGDYPGAVEMYRMAARTADPADREAQAWCLVQLGNAHWANGKSAEASAEFDKALELVPNYRIAVLGKARASVSVGDLAGAARILTENQGEEPEPDISILLSQIYEKQGDPEKARTLFAEGEAAESKNLGVPSEQKHLAMLWADNDKNLEHALKIALEEHGRSKDVYTADALAWSLYKNGRFREAADAVKAAMRLNTRDARIYYHAGMIRKALGDSSGAKKMLKAALELNPAFDLRQADIARTTLTAL